MGIPTVARMKRDLGITGQQAKLIRQAMEWQETGESSRELDDYYKNVVYGLNTGLYQTLYYYRRKSDRIFPALSIINKVLGTYGVETVPSRQDTMRSFRGFDYANTGDAYTATVIYDYDSGTWKINSWGGIVEAYPSRFGESESSWYSNPDLDEYAITELGLFIDNDANLYRQMTVPIQKNLINKMAAGKYNSSKALKAWENLAEEAAKRYTKEHGRPGVVWHVWFPIAERREVARRLRDFFEEEAKLGNYDDLLFKKYRR